MRQYPKTKEEAKSFSYGKWAGNPTGTLWKEGRCAHGVWSSGIASMLHQCEKKSGYGPDGLYCNTHAVEHDLSEGEEWFRTTSYWTIEPVCVVKHTDSRVWTKDAIGRVSQEASSTKWVAFHPTKEQAIQFLKARAEKEIAMAKATIEEMERKLENINTL